MPFDTPVQAPAQIDIVAIQSRLAELEARDAARQTELARAETLRMIQAGQHEAVVNRHVAEVESAKARAKEFAKGAALDQALSQQPILPIAVDQVRQLLIDKLAVDETPAGGFNVRTATDYRDVGSFVAATMADPNFSHFIDNSRRAAVTQQAAAAPAAPVEPAAPTNLGQAMTMQRLALAGGKPGTTAQGGTIINESGIATPEATTAWGLKPLRMPEATTAWGLKPLR